MFSCSLITGWRDWPKVLHPYNINPMTVASRIISHVHLNRKNYSHIHPQLPSLQLKEFKLHAANISISQDPPVTGVISWSCQDGMLCCGPYKPMNYLFGLQVFYFAQLMYVPRGVCISSITAFSLFCSSLVGHLRQMCSQLSGLISHRPWKSAFSGKSFMESRLSSIFVIADSPPHTHNSQDEWFLRHNNGLCYYWS